MTYYDYLDRLFHLSFQTIYRIEIIVKRINLLSQNQFNLKVIQVRISTVLLVNYVILTFQTINYKYGV